MARTRGSGRIDYQAVTVPTGVIAAGDFDDIVVDVSSLFTNLALTDMLFANALVETWIGAALDGAPVCVAAEPTSTTEITFRLFNTGSASTSSADLTVNVLRIEQP